MKRYRRWIAGLLAAGMLTAVSISASFAASAAAPFAEFRIDASSMDKPERDIAVNIYRQDKDGLFQVNSSSKYTCKLNRATQDAGFFIQANTPGVWVSVDYLTDINGDGVYELLENTDAPMWDIMDTEGALARPQPGSTAPTLTSGQPYILSTDLLVDRHHLAVQERLTGGAYALDAGLSSAVRQDFSLCMVKLHRTDPADGQDYTQTYYLQIYDDVLIPFDVSPSNWYYDAVVFGLSQGYFSGADNGLFQPKNPLSRAQMAQVLWSMSGSLEAEGARFSDVSPSQWFYPAVSWCQQEGLIFGYSPERFAPDDLLTREQMVTILHQYARHMGTSLRSSSGLSQFSDADEISDWARGSMQWAVANGLISGSDGALRPQDFVSRAELAAVLYSYSLNSGLRIQNFNY